MIHCIKLNIGITTSVSLVLSICVLFIFNNKELVFKKCAVFTECISVNTAHFLNTSSLLLSFGIAGGGGGTGAIDIVPLAITYASL